MAARFWVGGTGSWDAVTTTNWAASSGGAGGQSVPGASDDVTFDASSGGGTVTVTATQSVLSITGGAHTGTVDFNGKTITAGTINWSGAGVRSLTLGAANITLTGSNTNVFNLSTGTNLTVSFASSTITCTGTNALIDGGALIKTWGTVVFTGAGLCGTAVGTGGGATFGTLTRTGTAAKTDGFRIGTNFVITVALNINGNSTVNRLLAQAGLVGTSSTLNITGATVTCTNTDFQDITLSVTKDFSAQTDIGNCGGNSGITFPAPVTQTATGTASFTWSTHGWTTRVPLPQDDVVINNAFIAGSTVTADMPRLGRSLDFTGSTGTPTFALTSIANTIFGSLTLISDMTLSASGLGLTFGGRSSYTITSAGKTFNGLFSISAPGGTYTLQDALTLTGGTNVQINNGSFVSNSFSITSSSFVSNNAITRSITFGTSVVSLQATTASTVFNFTTATGLTLSAASSTIVIATVSASTRTFGGGGQTYGTLTYTVAGSTGELDITGSNSFAALNFSDVTNARTLKFTAATTTTIRNANGFNVRGTSGKLMVIDSITGATFTLTSNNQQSCDYLDLAHSVVDASPKWYAGANSTDEGTNTNWVFLAAPSVITGSGKSLKSLSALASLQRLS